MSVCGISARPSSLRRTAPTVLSLTFVVLAIVRSLNSGCALNISAISPRFCSAVRCRRWIFIEMTKVSGSRPLQVDHLEETAIGCGALEHIDGPDHFESVEARSAVDHSI